MNQEDYLQPLIHCTLCEHRCGVNRLEGQTGICRMTMPVVVSATLHPSPPESYTIFMAGCNYKYIGCYAKDKLWEYRILVIPKINEEEIEPLCCFIADIDADLPVCFLAFRPNYALEHHPGAAAEIMDRCVNIAKKSGLENAYWSGQTGIPGLISARPETVVSAYKMDGGRLAGAYAYAAGCRTHARNCAACSYHQACPVKRYVPQIQT
jgi:uncharacterized Fe-S radical SAM superfamily protein PflX